MKALKIENLNTTYSSENGIIHALKDVSLEVPEQRIVGIVGESGCGKSTLINTILGLLPQNGTIASGEIIFKEERDLVNLTPDSMRAIRGEQISMISQDPMGSLNPVISIGTQLINIQYRSSKSKSEKFNRAVEMLELVRIPDAPSQMNRYPHQFSGGMQQRIAIAMAIMMEPALLIADEPTTALDATLEVAVIELLRDLQKRIGCAILFISHHLGVIAELCQEVVVMYAGEVVERGSVDQIFYDPRHPYTIRLLECDPAKQSERTRTLPTIPGEIPDLRFRPKGCIFSTRCDLKFEKCENPQTETELKNKHFARCELANTPAEERTKV